MKLEITHKYNSKCQEFETARILKIQKTRPNLDQNHHLEGTKKEERKKKTTFRNPFLLFLPFVLFCLYYLQPFTQTKKKTKLLGDVSMLFQHPLQG